MSRRLLGLLADCLEALRFLSRLPLPRTAVLRGPSEVVGAFPLAGLAMGQLVALTDAMAGLAGLPFAVRDALVVVGFVLLSGGLHLDGLMDSCDGLFGGHTPERRLAIMRDSRVGSFGVLGGICVLLLKYGALGALHADRRAGALLLAPLLGRWSIVFGASLFPPARPDGLGAAFRAGLRPSRLAIAAGTSILAAFVVARGAGLLVLAASCGLTWLLGRLIARRIGGLTGDSYGALVELNETLALVVLAWIAG